jgi:mannosyltransferase OCH1-like enzyme
MSLLIPRVFHHIWLGDNPLPDNYARWANRWLELNPGWTIQRWTSKRLPDLVNRAEFDAGEKLAAKSDVLRYELVARYGGVYIDADMEPLRPIEPLLDNVAAFFGDERPDSPSNALIGCVPNHPFFAHLVKKLPESFRAPGDIVDKTGPRFLKRQIESFFGKSRVSKWDDQLPRRLKIIGEPRSPGETATLHCFDWRVFYPYYYNEPQREHDTFPDAYAKHHWSASWWKNGGV